VELEGTNILVTGGGGFVGAPTVRALIAAGARIRVLDAVDTGRLAGLDCELVIGDIADADAVGSASEGMEAVLHLAVLPLTLANAEHEVAFQTNVRGSFNVFRAAGEAGASRVVYSSASSAYGPTSAVPIREDHPLRPNAFYPATKAAAEMLLRGLAGAFGYSYAILRYMNVYGPGQRAGVVPAVSRKLLAGERPGLSGDGNQGFDFVHIEDCAHANLLALRAEVSGEDFNVGHGTVATLNELVATVGELLGTPLEPEYSGDVVSVPPRVGDVSKPRELLRFEAQVGFRDGLATVLDELREAQAAGTL
jgi:UDP-glucose 4-epimerase